MRGRILLLLALATHVAACSDDTVSAECRTSPSALPDSALEGALPRFEHGAFSCVQSKSFGTYPNENGYYSAARYRVSEDADLCALRYSLTGGLLNETNCNNYIAHRVVLFRGPADLPPAEFPADAATFDILGVDGFLERSRIVSIDREDDVPLLRLEAGDTFYVAIQMNRGPEETSLCVSHCADGLYDPYDMVWSSAAEPPFNWVPLADFGIEGRMKFMLDLRPPMPNGSPAFCPGR